MKKALAIILSLLMVLALVPFSVAAGGATLVDGLPTNGDKVVIYNPASGKALGACATAASYYNGGVDVTAADGTIAAVTDDIIWDYTANEDGTCYFSQNGKYLSMAASYSSTPYDEVNKAWKIEAFSTGYSIKNVGREVYLEWYASNNYFSGYYGISETAPGPFTFVFYKVSDSFVAPPTATPNGGTIAKGGTVALATTTTGATIQYSFDNVTFSEYTAPVAINSDCTLYAYAQKDTATSDTSSFEFTVFEGAMNIVEALAAGTIESGAAVYGQLVYRFGNYGGINSAIIQFKQDGKIYGLQVFNALENYTDATGTPIEIGDWLILTGKLGPYGGVQQMQSLTAIEKAPQALEGADASAAQEYASLTAAIADKANLLSEYILIKNVKLGEYNSNGSTTVTDSNDSTTKIGIYRAPDYTKWHAQDDVVDLYCVMSAYTTTSQLRVGTIDSYVMTKPDTTAPVITLPTTYLDAEVGVDYTINCTVEDYSALSAVELSYTIGGVASAPAAMTAGEDGAYSFTIPASAITGGSNTISFTVSATDAVGNNGTANGEFALVDLPQIVSHTPDTNEATGQNKRPTISFTFANAGTNPTITMTVAGEAVTPVVSGNTATYAPASDMADGKYTVTVSLARADGKSVEDSWNFYIGEATYQLYFGQLHSHTAQYSDGSGTLAQALDYAKYTAKNVDFIAITDHSNYFDTSSNLGDLTDATKGTKTADGSQTKWQEARALTKTYNDDTFVAVYGYEMTWSGQYGHMNTFNSVGVESRNAAKYVVRNGPGLVAYYDRLVEVAAADKEAGRTTTINQFNHPGSTFGTFEDFAHYSNAYDELITMVEVGNGEGKVGGSMYWPSYEMYTLALDKGWHVAPTNNQDNHKGGWGDSNTCRDVIYTDNFTEEGLYDAMRDMTMYATEDNDLEIYYTLNGEVMGSVLGLDDDATLKLQIDFNDPTDRVSKVSIITAGGVTVKSKSFGTRTGTWTIELPNDYPYYFVRIDEADSDIAVTAPIWTKDVTKVGITSLTKDTVMELKGEPITLTAALYNYEVPETGEELSAVDFKVTQVVWAVDGATKSTVNNPKLNTAGTNLLGSESDDALSWKYTPSALGRQTVDVTITGMYRGVKMIFTSSISFTVRDGSNMATMLIDAGHANFYVSGNYADSDTAFIELAAENNVKASHITEPITDAVLADCDLLVLTVPFKGASITVADSLYTEDELAAIARYAANGGNFIITSKSDRLEPANQNEWASVISNGILETIGAKARIGKGIVADVTNNTNESYRLHFMGKDHYNFASELCYDLIENTNSMFSCYNGAPVILNGATPVVTAFDTSFVSSYAQFFTGSAYLPNPTTEKSSYYYDACGDQEDVVVMAEETLPGGGFCITAGVTFFSTFEVKVELESASTLQNTNYQIAVNLFNMLNPDKVTPIEEIMTKNKTNVEYTIEGWVTSNASGFDQDTAFFDCIYLQDESGRGINVFPVSGDYQVGQKLRISGMTSSYMGEIELNAGNEYGGKVTDITIENYTDRVDLIDLEYTMADKQTVDTYTLHTERLQAAINTICAANKANLVEPAAIAENLEIAENGTASYPNQADYLMDVVTCARAMSSAKLGNLVEIYGKVTKIELDDNGVLGAIYVNDGSGTAIIFLDGYINCDCEDCVKGDDGYHDLSAVQVGAMVRIRGIASKGQNSYENSERIGSRIRIRNRADIEVWTGNIPQTGEDTSVLTVVGITMLIALLGVGVAIIRRRRFN